MNDILAVHRINIQSSLSNTKEGNWKNGFQMWSMIGEQLRKTGLYQVYEQSFINELVYFLFWYLESMKSFEAFRDCYEYIKHEVEAEFKILRYGGGFFFQDEVFEWYGKVMRLSLAEYLFEGRR